MSDLAESSRHVCRACGRQFDGHAAFKAHWKLDHGYRAAPRCHMNCSFRMTYHEVRAGRVLYGAGAREATS